MIHLSTCLHRLVLPYNSYLPERTRGLLRHSIPGPPHVKKHLLKDKLIRFNKQPPDFNVGLTFKIVFRNRQRKSTNLHVIRPGLSRRFLGGTASCVSSRNLLTPLPHPLPSPYPTGTNTEQPLHSGVDNVKQTRQSNTTFLMVKYPNHIKAP